MLVFLFSVIRQDGSVPLKYGLTLQSEARFSLIRVRLSRLCGIPQNSLILVDISQSQLKVRKDDNELTLLDV